MILVTQRPILGRWSHRIRLRRWKGLFALVQRVSVSRGTRRDNVNDGLWQAAEGWGREEGLLFSEVSIVWSWHSAVHYLLMSIHDVYCPAGTAWKHTLSEWEGNTRVQPQSCEAAWSFVPINKEINCKEIIPTWLQNFKERSDWIILNEVDAENRLSKPVCLMTTPQSNNMCKHFCVLY